MADNEVIRGDTKKWSIALVDAAGDPLDLAGCTIWFTLKPASNNLADDEDDSDAILQHKIVILGDGEVASSEGFSVGGVHPVTGTIVTGADSGVLTQVLSAEDSTQFGPGAYVYDLQVKLANGEVYTPINGIPFTVKSDVTRSTE